MKKRSLEIKWGIIFTVMMLLWMVGERLSGLHDTYIEYHATVTNFVMIPAIAIYVLAILDRRRHTEGKKFSYLQGFVSGCIVTLVVSILAPLSQYITSVYITPEYFENATAYAVETAQMTEEDAKEFFNLKNYMIITVFFTPITGVVTSAIVALFTRRKA